jgi:rod shape determining protein RodA
MSVLREKDRGVSSPLSVVQIVVHLLVTFGLIVVISRDLGSALVFAAIFAVMCFAGSVKLIWFVIGIAGIAAFAPYAWTHLLSQYQKDRIMAPYFPEVVDPDGLGITWHANQSKIALASGGLTGQGYMQGAQSQSDMLPFKHTDFIFAVAGEEFGAVGCVVLVLLLTAIILRCLYVGLKSHNYMNTLICCGFAAMLAFQTFENVGMCLGLTPVVGLTLPFISYGGSSVIVGYAAMGIVSGIRLRPNPNRGRY